MAKHGQNHSKWAKIVETTRIGEKTYINSAHHPHTAVVVYNLWTVSTSCAWCLQPVHTVDEVWMEYIYKLCTMGMGRTDKRCGRMVLGV